jgi:hypothetical protein
MMAVVLDDLSHVLNVGEPAGGEEGAGWPHPFPGDLEGVGGMKDLTVADFAQVLQQ